MTSFGGSQRKYFEGRHLLLLSTFHNLPWNLIMWGCHDSKEKAKW